MIEFETYMNKVGNREKLYDLITKEFNVKKALYPGSHIDITPSFFIPEVTYIDSFKGTKNFFNNLDDINRYVNLRKTYTKNPSIKFYNVDYYASLDVIDVDLIISLYAGFVSTATKRYLKHQGIILANDSHADATLLYHDEDFELIGVINNAKITRNNVSQYFLSKKPIDLENVKKNMKPPKYIKVAEYYLFRKVK